MSNSKVNQLPTNHHQRQEKDHFSCHQVQQWSSQEYQQVEQPRDQSQIGDQA